MKQMWGSRSKGQRQLPESHVHCDVGCEDLAEGKTKKKPVLPVPDFLQGSTAGGGWRRLFATAMRRLGPCDDKVSCLACTRDAEPRGHECCRWHKLPALLVEAARF